MSLRNKVLASGALVGSALLGVTLTSSGTLATWGNNINLDNATITSGNLEVAPLGNMAWSDSSDPANPVSIDLNTYKIVPGDTLTSAQDIDMALEGDNILASFDLDFALASSGDLLAGLTITYDIVDENGVVVVPETAYDTAATQFTVGENDVTADLDATKDYTVRIKVVFPDTTINRDYTEVNAILNSAQIHVKQVRSASGGVVNGSVITLGYSVSGGEAGLFSVQSDGTVKAWGDNQYGELGFSSPGVVPAPVLVPGVSNVVKVSSGYYHSLALTSTGEVYSWGNNYYGQLGNGGNQNFPVAPALISGLSNVKDVRAGVRYSMVVLNDGTVKTWGRNQNGQLGLGNTTSVNVPTTVPGVNGVNGIEISSNTSFAIDSANNVKTWGAGTFGMLGVNNLSNVTSPVSFPIGNMKKIDCGTDHCFGLTHSNDVYGWGSNDAGRLGMGTGPDALVPILVTSIPNVVDIRGFISGSAATDSLGNVYIWGNNAYGNLGYGDSSNRLNPIVNPDVPAGSELFFSHFSHQSFMRKPDNSWYVAGYGVNAALGDGFLANYTSFTLSNSAY